MSDNWAMGSGVHTRSYSFALLLALGGCLEPNPNYCPPERCNDAGHDASTDAPPDDGTAPDARVCVPELLFQRRGLFGHPQVYRVQLTDFIEHSISNGVDDDMEPEWSHDGRRVAVSRNGTSLWVVEVETGAAHQVDTRSPQFVFTPAWSPDDTRLIYSVANLGTSDPVSIFSASVEGSGSPKLLTAGADGQGPLDWSPDGARLAFISNRTGNLDVFSMAADGTDVTNLTNRAGADGQDGAAWSPDGNKLAFSTGAGRIWVINGDGSNLVDLSGTATGTHADPIWSPDGQRIYFVSSPSAGASLMVMNANGADQHSIDTSADLDLEPTPSPDGSRIAWSSHRDGNFEIYVSDPDGSNPIRVTSNADDDKHPRWRPCP